MYICKYTYWYHFLPKPFLVGEGCGRSRDRMGMRTLPLMPTAGVSLGFQWLKRLKLTGLATFGFAEGKQLEEIAGNFQRDFSFRWLVVKCFSYFFISVDFTDKKTLGFRMRSGFPCQATSPAANVLSGRCAWNRGWNGCEGGTPLYAVGVLFEVGMSP